MFACRALNLNYTFPIRGGLAYHLNVCHLTFVGIGSGPLGTTIGVGLDASIGHCQRWSQTSLSSNLEGWEMDFIETIFGIAPDGGSGMLELLLLAIPVAGSCYLLIRRWRRHG